MGNLSDSASLVTSAHRPTWVAIDLDALAANFHIVKGRVGPDVNVMAVVKANAYGHGAVECARRLEAEGANWFGVALPEEGLELRNAGITEPILCLAGFWSGQATLCIERKLVPVVHRLDMIEAFDRAARERDVVCRLLLEITEIQLVQVPERRLGLPAWVLDVEGAGGRRPRLQHVRARLVAQGLLGAQLLLGLG